MIKINGMTDSKQPATYNISHCPASAVDTVNLDSGRPLIRQQALRLPGKHTSPFSGHKTRHQYISGIH